MAAARLTAVFDDRDGADLALMRLRRKGIEYSVAALESPRPGEPEGMLRSEMRFDPVSAELVRPAQMVDAVLGSRAVMERYAAHTGRARLTLDVRSDQVAAAKSIIASVSGRFP